MKKVGFSIRCPHCFEWSDWENHPSEFALESEAEFQTILDGVKDHPVGFKHPKLLHCQHPATCPNTFQSCICKPETEVMNYLKQMPSLFQKRDFRLIKLDHRSRWASARTGEEYFGMLFCTQPVTRHRDITLHTLLDEQLLRRILLGMSMEMGTAVTVFVAEVFYKDNKPFRYWIPIEAHATDEEGIPPQSNKFCKICRTSSMRTLTSAFERRHVAFDSCPLGFNLSNGTCGGKQAACKMKPVNWTRCPAFLDIRQKQDACYKSDVNFLTNTIEKEWRIQGARKAASEKPCWASLTELGFPLIVHDHLVGVLMAGQFFVGERRDQSLPELLKKARLQSVKKDLVPVWEILSGKGDAQSDEALHLERFRISRKRLAKKKNILTSNALHIASVASARYRQFRSRLEDIFKQELLGRIESGSKQDDPNNIVKSHNIFKDTLPEVLERMRDFWAFEAVYLLVQQKGDDAINLVGMATKDESKSFGFPGNEVGVLARRFPQEHPYHWLLDKANPRQTRNDWLKDFLNLFHDNEKPAIVLPNGKSCYFHVFIPRGEYVYIFMFAARTMTRISALDALRSGGLSVLAQEKIFETCLDVIFTLIDVHDIRESRDNAWREFSARISHRFNNELLPAVALVDSLIANKESYPGLAEEYERDLNDAQSSLESARKMLKDRMWLIGRVSPRIAPVCVRELIESSARLFLPETAELHMPETTAELTVKVDPDLMRQCFRELMKNSIRAAGDHVKIDIAFSQDVLSEEKGDYLQIDYRDDGPGVPEELRTSIFKPGFTTHSQGTGQGLPTVREIIMAHNGTIDCMSSAVGAWFRIQLPIKEEVKNGQ